jgi:hypothetical protein
VVADIFHLTYGPACFDGAVCIRLFNLLNAPERVAVLKELKRVAETLIISYSHPYTLKHLGRLLRHRLGLREAPKPRLTRMELCQEVAEAGLHLRALIAVAPVLSEVWLAVLGANSTPPLARERAIPRGS